MLDYAGLPTMPTERGTMTERKDTPMRIALTREEKRQLKVKAAELDKSMSQFVADHLRESLRLKRAARK